MENSKDFRYRIYGTTKQFLGCIQGRNLEDDTPEGALKLSHEPLGKWGAVATEAIREEFDSSPQFKNNGVTASFLYDKDNDFELLNVGGYPTIRVLQTTELSDEECEECGHTEGDIALGFTDIKVAENFAHCLSNAIRILKEAKEGKNDNN